MKEYLDFFDVAYRVDEIYASGAPGYICIDCQKPFLIIQSNKTTGDLEILYNDDTINVVDIGCDCHINFDLFVDPVFGDVLYMPIYVNGVIILKPSYGFTWLANRLN